MPTRMQILGALRRRLRRTAGEERGTVIAFVAVSLVVLLGMAALAIDLSSFYQAQRQAQTAADAGALAASYDLPYSAANANTDGQAYALKDDPGSTATVSTPYAANANNVKVTVNTTSPSFFGTLFGITSAKISATAVAGATGTVRQGAIFAYANGGSPCITGVDLSANNFNISGGIQSNGGLTVNTNPNTTLDTGTWGKGCTPNLNPSSAFRNGSWAAPATAYPIDYRQNPPTCTENHIGDFTASGSSSSSPSVICATGTITVTGSYTGGVTLKADSIVVALGNNTSLSAPPGPGGTYGLLFWQTGTGTLTIGGNSLTLNGTIFVPTGGVSYTSNSGGTGFIEANTVSVSKNNFSITGDGPPVASNGYALLQ